MRSVLNCSIAVLFFVIAAASYAQDGVKGNVIRPRQVEKTSGGCTIKVAEEGKYTVALGDVIELDYTYPVVPSCIPTKVDFKQTLIGAIKPHALGIRYIGVPKLTGVQTIAFYFEAAKKGTEHVTLIIDKAEYKFEFDVQ